MNRPPRRAAGTAVLCAAIAIPAATVAGSTASPPPISNLISKLTDPAPTHWRSATDAMLPPRVLALRSMDAELVDLDNDGDLDLAVATEMGHNKILFNLGGGRFDDRSMLLPPRMLDSEDIAAADFTGDGKIDLIFVSEDTQHNEYYVAIDNGYEDRSELFPVKGTSNAVDAADIDNDGDLDVIIGNKGQNRLLLNDGSGTFIDATATNYPERNDTTQDVEFADIDNDGDPDIVIANEDDNRLLINNGKGVFTDESDDRLPLRSANAEVTREADFADIDGDGDLDLYFANTPWADNADTRDRILINDGTGTFTDQSESRLPTAPHTSIDIDFADIDNDGDLDAVVARFLPGGLTVLINDGSGRFRDETPAWVPAGQPGQATDVELADLDGDGKLDIFIAHWQTGPDQLLVTKRS